MDQPQTWHRPCHIAIPDVSNCLSAIKKMGAVQKT